MGIVYDPKGWTRPPASFRVFFSRGATGRVAMIDSPVLGLQIGALALGYREPLALSDAQLLRVTALYEKRRDNFSVFWRRRSGLLRAFRSGEVTLAAATESDALWLREQGMPVEFAAGALLTTADAQRAATVVRPADAAWLIAWTKARQPRPTRLWLTSLERGRRERSAGRPGRAALAEVSVDRRRSTT